MPVPDIDPVQPPVAYGSAVGQADFKAQPEDFQVEEVLGFEPSGEGEHAFLWVEKRGCSSNSVAAELARIAGIRRRLVSHCGLKDQQAITRQWFSLHLPGKQTPATERLIGAGFKTLLATRHRRKLKRGAHRGNRFQIRLRSVQGPHSAIAARWQQICQLGVPNYFGPQRFGNDGGNLDQARGLFDGSRNVSDRLLRGLLLSAARSAIFNTALGRRVLLGNWDQMLPGDVLGFPDNHSLILPHNRRGDEAVRLSQAGLHPTGPLWGMGEPPSEGVVRQWEDQAAAELPEFAAGLADYRLRQERRVTRVIPLHGQLQWEDDRNLWLRFELPSGCFATAVLRECFDLQTVCAD